MSRDFSKALENIRKAIHAQDAEFRREEGLGPKQPKPQPVIPSLKPEPKAQQEDSGGKFSANRFLETSINSEPKSEPKHEPEIVEVIPQKDSRHSWLYNEVAKAVQNVSDGNPNTKVVAVFVPVVQSGHELEELPVHETVELPPVNEEDFSLEDTIDIQDDPITPEPEPEPEPEPAPEPEPEIAQVVEEAEPEIEPEIAQVVEEAEPEPEPEIAPVVEEAEPQPEISEEQNLPEEFSAEPEQAEHLEELIPESIDHPDPELAEAFTTMEEKLDEHIAASNDQPDPEADPDSEKLPELVLPDELEDDEIIDDINIDESGEDSKTL